MKVTVVAALGFFTLVSPVYAQQAPTTTHSCPNAHTPAPGDSLQSNDFIELQRTACYGTCPVYTLRLYGDGRLAWHGEFFVKQIGEAKGHIPATEAKAILEDARRAGFWALCAEYTVDVTDQPSALTSLSINGQIKKVSAYGATAPLWLRDLDIRITATTDRYGWAKFSRTGTP